MKRYAIQKVPLLQSPRKSDRFVSPECTFRPSYSKRIGNSAHGANHGQDGREKSLKGVSIHRADEVTAWRASSSEPRTRLCCARDLTGLQAWCRAAPIQPSVISVTKLRASNAYIVLVDEVELAGTVRALAPALRNFAETQLRPREKSRKLSAVTFPIATADRFQPP
ncbi:hypothetical protein NKH17_28020 [Mesorhizobium sp. M1334]|uniref:hypothetical protein n=1 Tax=Mesorhizobium sp. M1334 TaxID=2957084 RepID=UPI00333D316E